MTLAIVDKGVASEVFGDNRPEAGREFFEWLDSGDGRLSSGGGNLDELRDHQAFRDWARFAFRFDRLRLVKDEVVRTETRRLEAAGSCKSNDAHVIALARGGGARLLYANDQALQDDFINPSLINQPRGKVYTTHVHKRFTNVHRGLLTRKDLSGKPQVGA